MRKKKRWQAAEEFMAELEKDPEYLRRRAEKDERRRLRSEAIDKVLAPILLRLSASGYPADSLQHLITSYAPLPYACVQVLLSELGTCTHESVQESLVRAIAATRSPYSGALLATLYRQTPSESLRFAILNTIALTQPLDIDDWIKDALEDPHIRNTLRKLGYRAKE